jgi:hypothetical protein
MNILHALDDRQVFAPFFKGDSWSAWRVFLAALFALPMTDAELAIYREHTGRTEPPTQPSNEAWLICGRRSGKSYILATVSVFLACFHDWRPFLGPGERATIMVIAADRKQARTILRYCVGLLRETPMLAAQIESETAESITLRNRITIEVHSASFRSVRGYSIAAALLDEMAFWSTDETSAEPDTEIINAVRPGMATIPNALLLCASSPYARKGELWNAHRRHFGQDGDLVLCWHAATRSMNPSVPQAVIDLAMARDPAHARAEFLAEFRTDIESYIQLTDVERCVSRGIEARPPLSSCRYKAFIDPSGGSHDSMCLSVAHKAGDKVIIDRVIEAKSPFSPARIVDQFADVLKQFRVKSVEGDRYGGEWCKEPFRKAGIAYEPAKLAKSDLYVAFLPLLTSGLVDLVDNPRLISQIVGLERRTARSGKDSIDHSPGGHDDLANVVAGACAMFAKQSSYDMLAWFDDEPSDLLRQEQLMFNRYVVTGGMR